VASAAAGAAQPASSDRYAFEVDRGGRRTRLLLVDDERVVREVLTQQLADEGYDVAEAADGEAALALLDSGERCDLLVSDLAMPGQDGMTVIREARRRRPGLPAILLTGYAAEAAGPGDTLGGGAFALLRKPISGARLANQAAALLDTARGASGRDGGRSGHLPREGGPSALHKAAP